MKENFIKFALNESGVLISSKIASKDESYFCIECGSKLTLRAGDVRVKHFAHAINSNCNGESLIHKTAKRLIRDLILRNSKGKDSIQLKSVCSGCDKDELIDIPPKTFTGSEEEISVSNFICDVVAYRNEEICLGIEIFNTHQVDENKKEKLSIPWIELDVNSVIEDPSLWNPTQSKLKQHFCQECINHDKKVREIADKFKINSETFSTIKKVSKSKYIADTHECFKCKQEIPIFWWEGVPFSQINPPEPKPHNIELRYSNKIDSKYYANTCANCGMIQGDYFLFVGDNSKFRNLPLRDEYSNTRDGVSIVNDVISVKEVTRFLTRGMY